MEVKFNAQNKAVTKEYAKPTAALKFVNFKSNHPLTTFLGIIKGQITRLRRLNTSNEDYNFSLDRLKLRSALSGYPLWFDRIIDAARSRERVLDYRTREKEENLIPLILPYQREIFSQIRENQSLINSRLRQGLKFILGYRNTPSLGQLLRNFPTPTTKGCQTRTTLRNCLVCNSRNNSGLDKEKLTCGDSGIYELTCKSCHQSYIGKTVQGFRKRIHQHASAIEKAEENDLNVDQATMKKHLEICYPNEDISKPVSWLGKVEVKLLHDLQDCSNTLLNTLAFQEDKYASLTRPSINRGSIFTFCPASTTTTATATSNTSPNSTGTSTSAGSTTTSTRTT